MTYNKFIALIQNRIDIDKNRYDINKQLIEEYGIYGYLHIVKQLNNSEKILKDYMN